VNRGQDTSAEERPGAGRVGSLCSSIAIHDGVSATIVLLGRLDAVEAPALREQFAEVFRAGAITVVVDLVGVSFIDSRELPASGVHGGITGALGVSHGRHRCSTDLAIEGEDTGGDRIRDGYDKGRPRQARAR